jgi:hypothetical protein
MVLWGVKSKVCTGGETVDAVDLGSTVRKDVRVRISLGVLIGAADPYGSRRSAVKLWTR